MLALPAPAAPPTLSPMLARCLLLALLLHVWLVLLLGNAPGGTARLGEGVFGAINITLRGPEKAGSADTAPPEPPSGPSGEATLPRWGGAVREAAPVAPPEPGAAQLGAWAARPVPAAAPLAPLAPQPLPTLPTVPLPAPAGRVLEERVAPPEPAPPAPPAVAAERSLSTTAGREAAAVRDLKPLESLAPAPTARPLALPPRLPELPLPVPAPVASPAPPPSEAVEEAPVRRLAAPPLPAPLEPVAPLPRSPALAAPNLPPLPALPAATALPPALPAPAAAAGVAPPGIDPTAAGSAGTPDAGSRVGSDVATPPAAAASTPPRLNLELARPRGGELSRRSAPGVLQLLPRPPELPDKLARDIEKSAKGDCRSAHSGAGLLAVVPLVVDAVRKDGGCKW